MTASLRQSVQTGVCSRRLLGQACSLALTAFHPLLATACVEPAVILPAHLYILGVLKQCCQGQPSAKTCLRAVAGNLLRTAGEAALVSRALLQRTAAFELSATWHGVLARPAALLSKEYIRRLILLHRICSNSVFQGRIECLCYLRQPAAT